MKQVKIIKEISNDTKFENKVNKFIGNYDNRDILDTQYQMSACERGIVYTAMIIYDKPKEQR